MATTTGERLRKLRNDKDLTQEELAHELGVSSSSVSRWERDEVKPRGVELEKLADYFKVAAGFILSDAKLETQPPAELPDFDRFLQTDYGQIAIERGWVNALIRFAYPSSPGLDYYVSLVRLMLDFDERSKARNSTR